ncbi:MAG: hypothetical protein KY464_18235, partial [Gemmatimonadetes bacterium]|nr:hypothetical protein [Gemmatimonadota bacterium]
MTIPSLRARLAGLLFLALGVSACDRGSSAGAEATGVPEEERYGGTMVMGFISDIADMNPLTSTDLYANQMQQFVLFMPLLQYDENFEPQPYFARSWEVNADTTLLTFHLRNDIFWHDGVKTSAHDVKFSYDRAREPEAPYAEAWLICGRRAGKSFVLALIAVFLACFRSYAEYLAPGERATIAVIATDRKQARTIYRYV